MNTSQRSHLSEKISIHCHHKNPFINKLFDLVEVKSNFLFALTNFLIQNHREPEVVTWSPQGTSFIVYNREVFSQKILPTLFSHKNLSSFTRQVSLIATRQMNWSIYIISWTCMTLRDARLLAASFLIATLTSSKEEGKNSMS